MDEYERQIVAKTGLWPKLSAWATAARAGVAHWRRTVQTIIFEEEKFFERSLMDLSLAEVLPDSVKESLGLAWRRYGSFQDSVLWER